MFRIGLPGVILRYAGGREVTLRDLQAMGLTSGINALIVGNYLTTLGRPASDDLEMLSDLRMPVGSLSAVI
jgi:biotin synthase